MEHSQLTFYQAQYQPSFNADQEKIDDFFNYNNSDALNTPNIDPDFFINEKNLFNPVQKSIGLKNIVKDPIDEFVFVNPGLGEKQQQQVQSTLNSSTSAASAYSPYSEDKQLESAAININSPEMMPVSPNKVCPQMDGMYAIEDDSTLYAQMSEYEKTLALYDAPSTSSNSRSSSISSGSGDNTHSYDYLFNAVEPYANDPSLLCRVPESPASVSSNYSNDSSNKTFTNLETASQIQPIQIKQEPIDMYHPTVLEDFENTDSLFVTQMQQPQAMPSTSAYSTLNPTDISSQYYYQSVSSLPITVANIQQQQQPQPQAQATFQQTSPATGGSRKRVANAAFASASTSSSSSTKKPRMTKREKQKMMENDISKFEVENRDLRQSIDLLERQIAFCKRFLSENVAPVIQRQQQIHHFGSPQMVVSEI